MLLIYTCFFFAVFNILCETVLLNFNQYLILKHYCSVPTNQCPTYTLGGFSVLKTTRDGTVTRVGCDKSCIKNISVPYSTTHLSETLKNCRGQRSQTHSSPLACTLGRDLNYKAIVWTLGVLCFLLYNSIVTGGQASKGFGTPSSLRRKTHSLGCGGN